MSQNDFVIANASGSAFRADVNSAFQALASLSSGPTAPSTVYALQLWFNDSANLLNLRDEANTNWVTIGSLVGTTWTPYSGGSALGTLALQNAASIAVDMILSAKQIKTALASVASASGVNLDAAAGNSIELTGTTNITSVTIAAGAIYHVFYTGAGLTLTHNATTLILPGGANIVLAAGDSFFVVGKAANQARILGFQRASGAALVGATSAAAQAAMEAATSTTDFVTPANFVFHPGSSKAWAVGEQSGTHSMTDFGVASITDNGVGLSTLTFDTAFSSTAYACTGFARKNDNTGDMILSATDSGTKSTTQFQVTVVAATSAKQDGDEFGVSYYGDR